jgi:hypothetical protein
MSIKTPFFDLPGRLQDTPKIACFPTLGAYFSRVDHLCPNPKVMDMDIDFFDHYH